MRIDLMLEAELIGIGALVTAAILDRVDMWVCNIDAALLVQGNDLVEAIGVPEAHDRQPAAGDAAAKADELQVLKHLVRKQLAHFGDLLKEPIMRIKALQVSYGSVGLQNLKRG